MAEVEAAPGPDMNNYTRAERITTTTPIGENEVIGAAGEVAHLRRRRRGPLGARVAVGGRGCARPRERAATRAA
jgi:hypothetical protein